MIKIYKILGLILIPILKLNILFRINQGKEILDRHKERYGISNYKIKNDKDLIWIHAASVGEFKSADYFITKYHDRYNILITTTTVSAANYAFEQYNDKIIHQFAPLDVTVWVERFLEKWQPKLIIWIESDLWPITLTTFKKKKIKAILVNLRLSPKSFSRWKIAPSFYSNLLDCFSDIFSQSQIDQKRIRAISNKEISYIGNLKLSGINNFIIKDDNTKIYKDPYKIRIMMTSTHQNEESKMLPIFKKILSDYKNVNLIIAPRHPSRSKELVSLFLKNNLVSILESSSEIISEKIIIIDSFGILSKYFEISDIVFLGGSLVASGGHNPIEPAIKKCAILTGPQIFNWQNLFDDMIANEACIKIKTLKELDLNIRKLIKDKNKIIKMKNNAYNFAKKQYVDTNTLDKIINAYMGEQQC